MIDMKAIEEALTKVVKERYPNAVFEVVVRVAVIRYVRAVISVPSKTGPVAAADTVTEAEGKSVEEIAKKLWERMKEDARPYLRRSAVRPPGVSKKK